MAILLKIDVDDQGRPAIKRLQGDIDKLDKTVGRSAKRQTSALTKLNGIWKQYGYLLTTGAVTGAVLMVRKFADMASAAEETANKFNVIFEGTTNLTESIAQMRKETGYAVSSLQEMTSGIGALVKPVGFSAEKTFELSKKITQLSLDIGSFMNLKPQDVVMNFQSALAGSSETLQKYGIDARETTLAQEAFNMGLVKSAKDYIKLAPEEKRRVRTLALIEKALKDTESAQGDLARTEGSYANQMRKLGESLISLGEAMGEKLLPVLIPVLDKINTVLFKMTDFIKSSDDSNTVFNKQINVLEKLREKFEKHSKIVGVTSKELSIVNDLTGKNNEAYEINIDLINELVEKLKERLRISQLLDAHDQKMIANANKRRKDEPIKTQEKTIENKEKIKSIDQFVLNLQQKAQANMHDMVIDTERLKQIWDEVKSGSKEYKDSIISVNLTLDQTLYKMAQIVNLSKGKFSLSKLLGIGSLVAGFFTGGATWAANLGGASALAGAFGFQHGGSFIVPGSGSPDSKMVAFNATPGETVTVTKPGQTINNNSNANINFVMNNVNQETIRNIIIPAIRKELSRGELKFA